MEQGGGKKKKPNQGGVVLLSVAVIGHGMEEFEFSKIADLCKVGQPCSNEAQPSPVGK